MNDIISSDHWNSFYRSKRVPTLPSQFAVFVLSEFPQTGMIVDFGCGNGRDTMFFAEHSVRTLGIDRSSAAIQFCNERKADAPNPWYLCMCVTDSDCATKIKGVFHSVGPEEQCVLYARFFLHALTDMEEVSLLDVAFDVLERRDGVFALEFRTHEDRVRPKVTSNHYRRFVNPDEFQVRAQSRGFNVIYRREGYYAKFEQDDAHVSRMILRRS